MKIAITAGASEMAQNIARMLIDEGHQVLVIDDLKHRDSQTIKYGQLLLRSLEEVGPLEMAFKKEQVQVLIHLEKYSPDLQSHVAQQESLFSRTLGLVKVADKLQFQKFLYWTSNSATDSAHEPLVKEMLENIRCSSNLKISLFTGDPLTSFDLSAVLI